MMFTEEIGLMIALARHPSGIRRSTLTTEARLVTRREMEQENDISVTNATIDSLLAQGMVARGREGRLYLTLDGAKKLCALRTYLRNVQGALSALGNLYQEYRT